MMNDEQKNPDSSFIRIRVTSALAVLRNGPRATRFASEDARSSDKVLNMTTNLRTNRRLDSKVYKSFCRSIITDYVLRFTSLQISQIVVYYNKYQSSNHASTMTEWQIIDSENFPDGVAEEPVRSGSSSRRRWLLLVGGIVLFLGAVGALTLRQRQLESHTALREDLTAHIFEEETRRYLGQAGSDLIIAEVSSSWAEAYWQTFETSVQSSPPEAIELTELDFDGHCAVVMAKLAQHTQARAYCLSEQGWRRAPVSTAAWGQEQPALAITAGVRLRFQARDQDFAETLAADLVPLLKKLERLPRWSSVSLKDISLSPLEIVIEPHDLHAPLIVTEAERIVLNSPWLVSTQAPEYAGLSGETAVRLALAKALLRRVEPVELNSTANLPGVERFAEAVQTVIAMHLLLAPEMQEEMLTSWRTRLQGRWISPFFANWQPGPKAQVSAPADAAATLMADYMVRLGSLDALHLALQLLPTTTSWDELFRTLLRRSTIVLENETALQAELIMTPDLSLNPEKPLLIPPLPLTATLLSLGRPTPDGLRLYVSLPDRTTPLIVEVPADLSFSAPEGAALAPSCITPGTTLEIGGDWLEVNQRLRATQVMVQQLRPFMIESAPVEPVAYVLTGQSYDPQAMLALSRSGRLYPISPLSSTLQVFPLPVASAEEGLHFLFKLDLPACQGAWFGHYEPSRGVSGQWLAPANLKQWFWRPDKQDIVFFSARDDSSVYDLSVGLRTSFVPQVIKSLSNPPEFVGWNMETGQFVFYAFEFNATSVGLFGLEAEKPAYQTYPMLMRGRRLSPDGNWLSYISSGRRPDAVPDRVEVIHLSTKWAVTLFFVRTREGVYPPVWPLNLSQPRLAVLAGDVADDQALPAPTRLLVTWPDQPGRPEVVAQAAVGERFISPVFCLDGALLYGVERQGEYRLQRQPPGSPAQTLLRLDEPFYPLACP
jgi:hypothetical protein